MFELMEKMYGEIINLKSGQDSMNKKLDSVDERLTSVEKTVLNLEEGQAKLEEGQADIKDHLLQLDSKNADRYIALSSEIKQIAENVEFIKHKEFKNEEELFRLKNRLEIIK